MRLRYFYAAALVALLVSESVLASGCSDTLFGDRFEDVSDRRFPVGLHVSGIESRVAVFQLNALESIIVDSDGLHCFSLTLALGSGYVIDVLQQPVSGGDCTSDSFSGTVAGPVTVNVHCGETKTLWDAFQWDNAQWQ